MQAKSWQWNAPDQRHAGLERKARTIATDWLEPLIGFAKIPLAVVPGANTALGNTEKFLARYTGDLDISPLDRPSTLTPLDGVPPPVVSKSGNGPVFFDGVEATFTVAHNGRGEQQILLEWIELCLGSFAPGMDPYFSLSRDGEEIIGAGLVEPMRFFIELTATGPNPARRLVQGQNGKDTMLLAQGPNVLNTNPASFYSLSPGEAPLMLKFTVSALDPGYYETHLRFVYRVGRDVREYSSEPIRLYTDGA